MNHTETNEDWEKRFKSIFAPDGDTINQILEYRGIYDCGKCFKEDEEQHYLVPIKQFIRSLRKSDKEQILGKMEEKRKEEISENTENEFEVKVNWANPVYNQALDTCKSIVEEVMK